ncbi:MAG: hypothetical protein ACI3YD_04400 [Alloprevotella sp.]
MRNYRYWVLGALGAAGAVALAAVPSEELGWWPWFWVLAGSKAASAASFAVMARLYGRWERRGEIRELVELIGND